MIPRHTINLHCCTDKAVLWFSVTRYGRCYWPQLVIGLSQSRPIHKINTYLGQTNARPVMSTEQTTDSLILARNPRSCTCTICAEESEVGASAAIKWVDFFRLGFVNPYCTIQIRVLGYGLLLERLNSLDPFSQAIVKNVFFRMQSYRSPVLQKV